MLSLDGSPLDCGRIARAARFEEPVSMTTEAWARVAAAHRGAERAAERGPVYGRNTGVGANRDVAAGADGHGHRLLRSHAAAGGAPLPDEAVRAMLVVRINQIAVGGSGVSPRTTRALLRMLNTGALPRVREHGTVGTGDLAALAGTGLTLLGERPASVPWAPMARFPESDALALVSSNALTLGRAALVVADLEPLLRAATVTTALSALAGQANPEAFSAEAARAAVVPGAATVARGLRELMGPARPARVQDSFGFRAAPQVQGVVVDALADLAGFVSALTGTAQENPLVVGDGVVHHGGFHMAALTLRLDTLRLAVAQAAPASLGRLRALSDPAVTRLPAFLATGPAGSSGTMIVEYTAASAYGVLRAAAAPASLETVVLSRGAEEDASFAPLAVRQSETATVALRTLVACELLTALRALAMRGSDTAVFHRAWHAFRAQGGANADTDDRDLQEDLDAAERALPQLGAPPPPRSDTVPERAEASGFRTDDGGGPTRCRVGAAHPPTPLPAEPPPA